MSQPEPQPQTHAQPKADAQPQTHAQPEADAQPQTQPQPGAGSKPQSYESATARVEEIIRRLDSGEASLNETLELVREGKTLIELCAGELEAVGNALEELRLDELVSRLEGEAAT